jgi:hypothetical protein
VTVKIYLFWVMTPCPFDIGCMMPQILEENVSSFFIVEEEVVRKYRRRVGHGAREVRQYDAGT